MPGSGGVSPTLFRVAGLRFFFFSREESRLHVYVAGPDGDAKFWLEPELELAENHGLSRRALSEARRVIEERTDEIRTAWSRHFGG